MPATIKPVKPFPDLRGEYVVALNYDGEWVAHVGANTPEKARAQRAKLPQWPDSKVRIVWNVPRLLLPEGVDCLEVKCAECGWDDSGDLRLVDYPAYAGAPGGPWGDRETRTEVVGDPEPGSFRGECKQCGAELDATSVVVR